MKKFLIVASLLFLVGCTEETPKVPAECQKHIENELKALSLASHHYHEVQNDDSKFMTSYPMAKQFSLDAKQSHSEYTSCMFRHTTFTARIN